MNLKQYNALTGDTKLAAALAIAMGWNPKCVIIRKPVGRYGILQVTEPSISSWRIFDPFTDASIPYGLLCNGVDQITQFQDGRIKAYVFGHYSTDPFTFVSKTHAIVLAYIAADPMGHLAKFLSTKE